MTFGILSVGAYIPRLRLSRSSIGAAHRWMSPSHGGKGSRAFCSWDEDTITMAVEAGRDCLREFDRSAIGSIRLASTTFPYADLQNSVVVAGALDLEETTGSADFGGSQRCATTALLSALRGGDAGAALVIASERPVARPGSPQELSYGAGAAAFAVGDAVEGERLVARLVGFATIATNFVDHFRAADQRYDYVWEERWVRDEGYGKLVPRAVSAALANADLKIADIAHFVLPAQIRGAAASVAKGLGFAGKVAEALDEDCGHTGAAHGLLMLAKVLESASPGERVLVVGFGQGVDALILEVIDGLGQKDGARGVTGSLADRIQTEDYLRMCSFYGTVQLDWGVRSEKSGKASLTEAYRSQHQLGAFNAGRCKRCGTVQFPQLAYCVEPECKAPASEFEAVSLADEPARVLTYTADWLTYHPAPPLYVGFVQFDNGARLLMEMVDAAPDAIDVGVPLRMVFRIKERDAQRGYTRYFWKATPAV